MPEQERQLADILKSMSRRGFPLVGAKVKKLTYQYAEKQGINTRFSEHRGTAGLFWLNAFLSRNGLSLRKPEALSVGRASGMNETVASQTSPQRRLRLHRQPSSQPRLPQLRQFQDGLN